MSREFGSDASGYFHQQMQNAADDCLDGRDKLTKLWGAFFKEFYDVAYAISTSEAGDSGPDFPILETIKKLPALKDKFNQIENYCSVFDDVAQKAIRDYLEQHKTKKPVVKK